MIEEKINIRIDKEGNWFYGDAEMFRKDIVSLLAEHIKRDDHGRYFIDFQGEQAYIEVEDTPYVVTSIERIVDDGKEAILLIMSHGSKDKLDPTTLLMNDDNVLYCTVKDGLPARFRRQSYYQLAKFIEMGEDGRYFLNLNNKKYYIKCNKGRCE